MKLITEHHFLETEGVMSEKKFTVKLDRHMMDLLSNLYSNIPLALVREYWTNAEDGHRALRRIGGTPPHPIKVHVPNSLDPFFRVTDFGIGMDHDTVFNVFTQYGNSTKQDSNLDVGGLGIGAKSAFCYKAGADQWSIESRFDGTIRTYVAAKDSTGMPTLVLLGEQPTTESTGITITIPVAIKDIGNFKDACKLFARRREEAFEISGDTTGVNAGEYKPISYIRRHPDVAWRVTRSGEQGALAVMGGVTYPIDLRNKDLGLSSAVATFLEKQGSVDIFFDIGELEIVPSREGLKYTTHTINRIKDKLKILFKEHIDIVDQKITTFKNPHEIFEYITGENRDTFVVWKALTGKQGLPWRGFVINENTVISIPWNNIVKGHTTALIPGEDRIFRVQCVNRYRKQPTVDFVEMDTSLSLAAKTAANGVNTTLQAALAPITTFDISNRTAKKICLLTANFKGAQTLLRKFIKNDPYGKGDFIYYLFLGKWDPTVISAELFGLPVQDLNQVTDSFQKAKSLNALQGIVKPVRKQPPFKVLSDFKVDPGHAYWAEAPSGNKSGLYVVLYDGRVHADKDVLHPEMDPLTTLNTRLVARMVQACITLGVLDANTAIYGVPISTLPRITSDPQLKLLWEFIYPKIETKFKQTDKPILDLEEVTTLLKLPMFLLSEHLKSKTFTRKREGFTKVLTEVMTLHTKLTELSTQGARLEAINTVLKLFPKLGNKFKGTTTTTIDRTALFDYNSALLDHYAMLKTLLDVVPEWQRDRILGNNIPAVVNYINAIDSQGPIRLPAIS